MNANECRTQMWRIANAVKTVPQTLEPPLTNELIAECAKGLLEIAAQLAELNDNTAQICSHLQIPLFQKGAKNDPPK